jgi:hypothetical protein
MHQLRHKLYLMYLFLNWVGQLTVSILSKTEFNFPADYRLLVQCEFRDNCSAEGHDKKLVSALW